jgi:hypothetical protein
MSDLLEYSRARKEVLPRVLQAHHRWQQLKAAVPIAIVGLGIALGIVWILNPTWHAPKSWHLLALVWGGAFIFTGGLAAVGWRYASSRSLLKTAQTIDRKLETKNRLEALTDLRDPASPLGRAQLEETKAYLEQEPRARRPWLLPWLLTALAMLVLLHLATLLVWAAESDPGNQRQWHSAEIGSHSGQALRSAREKSDQGFALPGRAGSATVRYHRLLSSGTAHREHPLAGHHFGNSVCSGAPVSR